MQFFFLYLVIVVFFFLSTFCARDLSKTIRPIPTFFSIDDWTRYELHTFWIIFLSSIQVLIYQPFCTTLRPVLCTQKLRNYQIYEYEVFRIGRSWSNVCLLFLFYASALFLELIMARNFGTNFDIFLPFLYTRFF